MRTDPAAICFRLTAAQMSVIWPGLDLILKAHITRREKRRVLYAYPFDLYPLPRGYYIGTYNVALMNQIIALWNALRTKSTTGGRVQMNAIQVRAAIFAVRVNQGLWRRRNNDVRRRNADTKRMSTEINRMNVEAGHVNTEIKKSRCVDEENLEPLRNKSQRVLRSLERHMKQANRHFLTLVPRDEYAALMDAWRKHLRWMRLRLVYFTPLRPATQGGKHLHQIILDKLGEMAEHGLRSKGYQPPDAKELRRIMRLYVQYARRGREYNYTLPTLMQREQSFIRTNHLAHFVLDRVVLEPL
jgi:hypothetical protein